MGTVARQCVCCGEACCLDHGGRGGDGMVLELTGAPGAMTGERYIESLRDGREVWIDGERVADVTTHPAFKDFVHELARVYDLQHTPEYRDQMTFESPY